jgi:hypothetical protein
VDRSIALSFLDLGARKGWVVSTTPRPHNPRERPGTHCTGGWVDPRAGLDVCEKSRPTGIRSPDRPSRSQSLYRMSYLTHSHLASANIIFSVISEFTSYIYCILCLCLQIMLMVFYDRFAYLCTICRSVLLVRCVLIQY